MNELFGIMPIRFAVERSSLPSDFIAELNSYLSRNGWSVVKINEVYVADEAGNVNLLLPVSIFFLGSIVSLFGDIFLLFGAIIAVLGLTLLLIKLLIISEKNAVAYTYSPITDQYVFAATSPDAFIFIQNFIKSVNRKINFIDLNEEKYETRVLPSITSLETVLYRRTRGSILDNVRHLVSAQMHKSAGTAEETKVVKLDSNTISETVVKDPIPDVPHEDNEDEEVIRRIKEYEDYLFKLEKMRKENILGEKAYRIIRREYENEIEKLKRKLKSE